MEHQHGARKQGRVGPGWERERAISFLLVLKGCRRLRGSPMSTLHALPPAPSLSEEEWLFAIKTKILEFRTVPGNLSSPLLSSLEGVCLYWGGYLEVVTVESN